MDRNNGEKSMCINMNTRVHIYICMYIHPISVCGPTGLWILNKVHGLEALFSVYFWPRKQEKKTVNLL